MNRGPTNARLGPWSRPALFGCGLWVTWALVIRPEWTAVLLLLSPFVLVPLGISLATGADTGPEMPTSHRLSSLAPLLAATAAASFVPKPGVSAALISVPWMLYTLAIATVGATRLLSRRTLVCAGIGADAGLVFVAVGGVWLTISRAGLNPLGFSDAIVELTAVHFHYAGFALPIVAGLTASRLNRSVLVPLAVVIGVPLTAAGIVAGGWLEWTAATAMSIAGLATAGLLLQLGARQTGSARWLTAMAGLALLAGMSLAFGWAWSIRFGWDFLGREAMAAAHGSLNALGFGLLGLIGLNLLPAARRDDTTETNINVGRSTTSALHRLAERASRRQPTNPAGLLNRPTPAGFRRTSWQRQVDGGDFVAAANAIRQWRGHREAGVALSPACPRIAVGETLSLWIPLGPVSATATCRIIEVIDEPDRFGFTYATLPHHPEDGEESFLVTRHEDGTADVTVTAVWRPATVASRLCPPFTRYLQNRITTRYLDGIAVTRGPAEVVAAIR